MKKRVNLVIKFLFLTLAVVYAITVFVPRKYEVPTIQERAGTQYWALSTGSRIAFFHMSAKGNKKPYPIIYLHGGPGGHVRDDLIRSLEPLSNDGYDIYFYDQVGSGMSSRLKDITDQPWGYTYEYTQVFKNHELKVIPSAGHFLWIEQPQRSYLAISQFLVTI